ncbi:MAG: toxic anion resistance protein [Lachnospiraceae bacterium]|nr:toxic anion resistance protein [Lachnospiraceae bacterium]
MDNKTEIKYLRVLVDNELSDVSEAQLPLIEENIAALDVSDIGSITKFGSDTQKHMAELSQMVLNNLNSSAINNIDELMQRTIETLTDINDTADNTSSGILFWRKKNRSVTARKQYDEAARNVDRVAAVLEDHQVRLLRDCALLNQLFDLNEEYYQEAAIKIAAAKLKAEELREQAIVADETAVDDSWRNTIIDRLEKRATELATTRVVSRQQAAQIRMLQANFAVIADKLQSTLYTTIPLWKSQIVLALGAEHARQALQTDRSINEMTNRLLTQNAKNLKNVTAETQKAYGEQSIRPETLAETNRALIESLDEVMRIQNENRIKRESVEHELVQIDRELQVGLFPDRDDR